MTLSIEATWGQPSQLRKARSGAGYVCPDLKIFPEEAGVYVFGRQHGETIQPLYIGRAGNLRVRMAQQFDSMKLMTHGARVRPTSQT